MTVTEMQSKVDTWVKDYGIRYFGELTNMALLMEEVGEVARLIAREYGEQSFKESENQVAIKDAIADEMADVIFVLTCLANQIGINLDQAIEQNFQKKTLRDSARHKNNPKLGY